MKFVYVPNCAQWSWSGKRFYICKTLKHNLFRLIKTKRENGNKWIWNNGNLERAENWVRNTVALRQRAWTERAGGHCVCRSAAVSWGSGSTSSARRRSARAPRRTPRTRWAGLRRDRLHDVNTRTWTCSVQYAPNKWSSRSHTGAKHIARAEAENERRYPQRARDRRCSRAARPRCSCQPSSRASR